MKQTEPENQSSIGQFDLEYRIIPNAIWAQVLYSTSMAEIPNSRSL